MSRATAVERQMLDLINEERAARGLDPLRLELRLNEAAEDHSAWMLREDVFSHTGAGGSNPGARMREAGFEFEGSWSWAENVAWQSERGAAGIGDDVKGLHRALMDSPGHRANILNANVEVVGIGIERGDFRGYDAVMVTQAFARTDARLRLDGSNSGGGNSDGRTSGDPTPTPSEPGRIVGTKRADTLVGTDGADEILGRGGRDTIEGRDGDDVLKGGGGWDVFVFDADDGRDRIRDFKDGRDRIGLDADDAGSARLRLSQDGADAIVRFGQTTVVVEDTTVSALENDFVLV